MKTLTVAGIALVAFGLALVLVCLRLRWWARRYAEVERERDEVWQARVRAMGTEALWMRERLDIEGALTRLWPRLEVQTPEQGAAVAVLRAAFPSLPVPGKSQNGSAPQPLSPEKKAQAQEVLARLRERTSCPKCKHPYCAAPNRCDDPEHAFGGIGR